MSRIDKYIRIVCSASMVVVVLLILTDGCGQKEGDHVNQLKAYQNKEKVYLRVINRLKHDRKAEVARMDLELNAFKNVPIRERIKVVKVFEPSAPATDSTITFTATGIDSLGQYVIVCESIKRQLNIADSTIAYQDSLHQIDSTIIGVITSDNLQLKSQVKKAKRGQIKFGVIGAAIGFLFGVSVGR